MCVKKELDVDIIYEAYLRTGSVHRAGAEFGMHGETVRRALLKAGKKTNRTKWKPSEIAMIAEAYSNPKGFNLALLSQMIGRSYVAVCVKAGKLGMTTEPGKFIRTPETRANLSRAQKEISSRPGVKERRADAVRAFFKRSGHPRGMLGKHHTQAAKDAISRFHTGEIIPRERVLRQLKTRLERYGTIAPDVNGRSWKSEWRTIGGQRHYYRSSWEANYARYLEQQKQSGLICNWEHECERFWFDPDVVGCVSYLPDFRVTNNDASVEYHEVKGWMDEDSATKIRRMAEFHPEIKLVVRDPAWYKANQRQLSQTVPGWEKPKRAHK